MTVATAPPGDSRVGPLLRSWRERRRISQLDLAIEAGISARHLSFVETGRSRPSAEMVLHLAEQLEVPLRDRNTLLLAAGYAPAFSQRTLEDPEMAAVREALDLVLSGHEPFPAAVVDRHWYLVAGNAGLGLLTEGVAPHLLADGNAMRLALHPEGLAPRIRNLAEWRAHLIERLDRQVAASGDAELAELRDEVAGYPHPHAAPAPPSSVGGPSGDIFVPLRLASVHGELVFFATVQTFGTALDITVSELSIESFFPADARTRTIVAARVGSITSEGIETAT